MPSSCQPRSSRRRKIRDLYDLDRFGRGSLDEPLSRRLLVLKVWHDVADDGLLTQPVDPAAWLARVRDRYQFVTELDAVESGVAACNSNDRYRVSQLVNELVSNS